MQIAGTEQLKAGRTNHSILRRATLFPSCTDKNDGYHTLPDGLGDSKLPPSTDTARMRGGHAEGKSEATTQRALEGGHPEDAPEKVPRRAHGPDRKPTADVARKKIMKKAPAQTAWMRIEPATIPGLPKSTALVVSYYTMSTCIGVNYLILYTVPVSLSLYYCQICTRRVCSAAFSSLEKL